MDGIRYGLMRNPMPVSPVALAIAMVLVSAAAGAAQSGGPRVEVPHVRAATVDGVIDEAEWRGAWRTTLSQGTEVRLMHDGRRLFVGLSKLPGAAGWACAFVAPAGRSPVRVLHASAQLGSAIYDAAGAGASSSGSGAWSPRSATYAWKVAERLVREEGWMANVSAKGDAAAREFAIDLDRLAPTTTTAAARGDGAASGTAAVTAATTAPTTATAPTATATAATTAAATASAAATATARAAEAVRFAIAYASITQPDNARGLVAWPESAKDAVRNQRLVDGWNPAGLTFEPTTWTELAFRPAPQP